MKKHNLSISTTLFILLGIIIFNNNFSYSQVVSACSTPTYTVDLSANPEAVFVTPVKLDRPLANCCSSPNVLNDCRVFYLIRHPNSAGIEISLSSPDPAGNGGMLLNGKPCPTPYSLGQPQCIPTRPGLYTDTLTFCKNGNGATNYYTFTSKAAPTFPPDQDFRIGCTLQLKTYGVVDNSTGVSWTGIAQPGYSSATLNSYLSFTSPGTYASPIYSPPASAPAVVEYQVTGSPSFTLCPLLAVTETVTITNHAALTTTISPSPATFCNVSGAYATLTATPSNGLAPYSYIWKKSTSTNLGIASTYTTSTTGTYSVVVTDAINSNAFATCPTVSSSVVVNSGVNPIMNAGADDTLCATDPTINLSGSITQGATGGTWTGGTTSGFNPSRNVLNAVYTPTSAEILAREITFTLTSTGAGGGCVDNSDIVKYTFSDTVKVSISSATLNCYNSTATLTASGTGGTSPLTYHWNTGATTSSISVGQGNFTALVTDKIGCTGTASTNLTAPTSLALTFTTSDVTTNGGSNGQASANVSGGTSPYTYLWTPGNKTTSLITGLSYGVYTATITDANNCTISGSVVINEPRCNGFNVTATSTNVTCYGSATGTGTAVVSGGTPQSYSWSNTSQTTANVNDLPAGVYTVTVVSTDGCIQTANITVTEPPILTNTFNHSDLTVLSPPNGSATSNPFGGTAPYTYLWSPGSGTTQTINNLSAGVYTVYITDANGCLKADSIKLNNPDCNQVVLNVVSNNVACYGASTGTATADVVGATAPYSYLWYPGNQTTASISNLPVGYYSVTLTDGAGCVEFNNFTITQPSNLSASISTNSISCRNSNDGTADLYVSGGVYPYTYLWSNGGATTEDLINANPGTYTVTVVDANTCSVTATASYTNPDTLVASYTSVNPTCIYGTDGSIDYSVTGGVTPYSYLWLPGNQTTQDISGLDADDYTILLDDANGCSPPSNLIITISNPDSVYAVSHTVACADTTLGQSLVTIVPGGGNGGRYYVSFDNGANYQVKGDYDTYLVGDSTYNIWVQDSTSCVSLNPYPVVVDPFVEISNVTFSNCFASGATTTTFTVTATGGDGSPLSISYNGGGTYQTAGVSTFTVAVGASYSIIAKDGKGCTSTVYNIRIPDVLEASITSSTNILCKNGNNGAATVSATGGDLDYTYLWDDGAGQVTATATGLTAGTYSVTVTDGNGCTRVTGVTITEPTLLTSSASVTSNYNGEDISCYGENDGEATVTPSGGTGAKTYLWSDGGAQTTAIATGLTAGTYTVTVTDANSCVSTSTVTLTDPTLLTSSAAITSNYNGEDISCNGASDGQATVTPTGGTGVLSYLWNDGGSQTTAIATGLDATSYTVTVTDVNGCLSTSTVTLTEPTVLSTTMSITSNYNGEDISCNGVSDGMAKVTPSGGTGSYTYLWNDGGSQTTAIATGLDATSYTVTVTDVNGCVSTSTVTLTEPPVLTTTMSITSNYNGEDISCNGASDGEATVTPSGGTGAYTYLWNDIGAQTTATATDLDAISYTVTVNDVNGCVSTSTVTLTEPTLLTSSAVVTSNYNGENISCYGASDGEATVTPAGGTGALTYLWNDGAAQTTAIATGLTAGTYIATVTDVNGCVTTSTVTLTEPTLLTSSAVVTSNYNGENISCYGASDGEATVTPAGGTGALTYLWNDGGAQTTAIATGLDATSYTVTVTDVNGCISTSTVTLTEPTVLTTTMSITSNYNGEDISCNGASDGKARVTTLGGTGVRTYLWNDGGAQTTSQATGLSAGSYTVTVTDVNGCVSTSTVTLTEPPLLTTTMSITSNYNGEDISCNGASDGQATVTPAGGTGALTYLWNDISAQETATATGLDATSYTVTVTDVNGCVSTSTVTLTEPTLLTSSAAVTSNYNGEDISCNGASDGQATVTPAGGTGALTYLWNDGGAQTTAIATGLDATSYTVTVTDVNGCVTTSTVTLTEPDQLTISSTVTNETCDYSDDGSITTSVNGGTGPFTYFWTNTSETTASISGLVAATYTVTTTDVNGCTATDISILTQPAPLAISYSGQANVKCNGGDDGAVTAGVTGGTPNYSYVWMPGSASTSSVRDLTADTYTTTITDENGCVEINTVTITEPLVLTVAVSADSVLCYGTSTGTVTATPSGGTGPFSYQWSISGGSTQTVANVTAGNKTVYVTDANACVATNTVTVGEPDQIVPTVVVTDATCTTANGIADITAVAGGSGPFTYEWSNGATTNDITGVFAGHYTFTVTDSHLCTNLEEDGYADVNDAGVPVGTLVSKTDVSCFAGTDGEITFTIAGGTPPYTVVWLDLEVVPPFPAGDLYDPNPGPSFNPTGARRDSTISKIPEGTYTAQITDVNGCKSFFTESIGEPEKLTAFVNSNDVTCYLANDGDASVEVFGGTPGYSYAWSGGASTISSITGLSAASHTVTITDANNCILNKQFDIEQPDLLEVTSISSTPVLCYGESNGTATVDVVAGGTEPYGYSWMPGSIEGQGVSNLSPNTYTVTITDLNSCVATATVTVTEPDEVVLVMSSVNSNCSLANGQASVVATGGTGAATYSYLWTPVGGTNDVATGLFAQQYTVTVSDGNGCTKQSDVTVNDNPSPVATITSHTNVYCKGGNTGDATVSVVVGGSASLTYLWSPSGGTTTTAANLVAGTYSVTVTDGNGCTSTDTETITEPAAVLSTTLTAQTNVYCKGGNTGTATVKGVGGSGSYSYLWNDALSQTTSTATGLTAASYTVTVFDNNGCLIPVEHFVTITEPVSALSATVTSQTNVYCKGDNTGSATVTASGGSGSYSYQWNNPFEQITATATDLSAGSYTVTVFDNNGCTVPVYAIATITEPAAVLSASVTAQTNVYCRGGSTGAATVTALGGSGSYSYLWNDALSQTTATATGLSAGAYSVVVYDNNGCLEPVFASVTLTQPATVLSASITAQTNVSCTGGNTGTATVTASGGSGSYSYLWNNPLSQTTATATGLFATTYTVTVTDNNGCLVPVLKTVTIIEPLSPLTATITAQTNVYCKSGSTGVATVTASGGSGNYAYLWNDALSQTTATAAGLSAGSYTVAVSDKNGCALPVEISTTITEPIAALSATVTAQTNVYCKGGNNGVATITASGGSGSYSYLWNDALSQTTATATGLSADVYTILVFDNNGCLLPAEVLATVTEPSAALSATITAQTNVYCKSGTTGSATVTASGGSGSYSYLWNDALFQTTATATGLSAASYTVAVFDNNGCIIPVEKYVTITEPSAALSATITAQTNVYCKAGITGSATVTASGGSGSYSYLWNDALSQTTKTASGLSALSYTVAVSDNNGCVVPVFRSVTITEPGANLTATVTAQTNVVCRGGNTGTATVTASGGSGSYSYLWSNISLQTTATATGLIAKTYTVTVTDNNGCTSPVKVSTVITEPSAALTATITAQTNVLCKGGATGSATLTASGGSGSYLYVWNDALTQSTATASGLTANSYTVTVMDANGCAIALKKVATITEPTAVLSASITAQTNVFCKGDNSGIATVTARGGSGSYSYLWDDASAQTTATATGLFAGPNTVTVTDNNGCIIPAVEVATITEPTLVLSTTLTAQTNVYCKGDNTGSATVTGVGGSGMYNYSWNDDAGQNTATATGLAAGSYTVTVSDQNGCVTMLTQTVTITEPALDLDATTSKTDITCYGGADGIATVTGIGGSGNYSYLWSNTETTQTITGLVSGIYTVKVTDNNGCSEPVYKTATITQPAGLLDAAATSQTNVSCFGLSDASVTVTASGGSGSYSYSWSTSPVQTTATVSGLAEGTYTVTVNDNNGCTVPAIEVVTITEPTALSANITSHTDIYCHIDSSGTATVTATGGTLPYSYLWSSSQTAPTSTYLDAGGYTVVVTDFNGCVFAVTDSVFISDSSVAVTLSSPVYNSIYNISTFQGNDGAIDLNVIGGVSPFVYAWSNGSTTQDLSGLTAGTYSVTVTDFAGCLDTATIVLTEPNDLWMPTGITPNGDGFNDALFVTGLNAYPTNHLIVFNRWGNIVFEIENYNSDWYGTNKQGEPLAEGTYFVILEVNNKEKVLAQYLDIRR